MFDERQAPVELDALVVPLVLKAVERVQQAQVEEMKARAQDGDRQKAANLRLQQEKALNDHREDRIRQHHRHRRHHASSCPGGVKRRVRNILEEVEAS